MARKYRKKRRNLISKREAAAKKLQPKVRLTSYQNYLARYAKADAKMKAKGQKMFDRTPFTEEEYKAYKERLTSDLEAAGKPVRNINQTLVSSQQYKYSYEQGLALRRFAKATGQNVTIQQIRTDINILDFSDIGQFRDELFAAGLNKKEVRDWISREFFGSK